MALMRECRASHSPSLWDCVGSMLRDYGALRLSLRERPHPRSSRSRVGAYIYPLPHPKFSPQASLQKVTKQHKTPKQRVSPGQHDGYKRLHNTRKCNFVTL